MKKQVRNVFFSLVVLLNCLSCTNQPKLIGKIPVQDMDGLYFRVYQHENIDYINAISFDVIREDDSVLSRQQFVTSHFDDNISINEFATISKDSVIYLTQINSKRILGLYDLRENWGFPLGLHSESYNEKYYRAKDLLKEITSINSEYCIVYDKPINTLTTEHSN